jgi:hypothetical protein
MSLKDTILFPLIAFIVTCFILHVVLSRLFPKFKNIKLRFKLASLTGLSHFVLVAFLCALVAISIKNEPEAGMIFGYLYFFDFLFFGYVSFLNGILSPVLSYNVINVVVPFIAFGLLGSIAYACLGLIAGRVTEILKGIKN